MRNYAVMLHAFLVIAASAFAAPPGSPSSATDSLGVKTRPFKQPRHSGFETWDLALTRSVSLNSMPRPAGNKDVDPVEPESVPSTLLRLGNNLNQAVPDCGSSTRPAKQTLALFENLSPGSPSCGPSTRSERSHGHQVHIEGGKFNFGHLEPELTLSLSPTPKRYGNNLSQAGPSCGPSTPHLGKSMSMPSRRPSIHSEASMGTKTILELGKINLSQPELLEKPRLFHTPIIRIDPIRSQTRIDLFSAIIREVAQALAISLHGDPETINIRRALDGKPVAFSEVLVKQDQRKNLLLLGGKLYEALIATFKCVPIFPLENHDFTSALKYLTSTETRLQLSNVDGVALLRPPYSLDKLNRMRMFYWLLALENFIIKLNLPLLRDQERDHWIRNLDALYPLLSALIEHTIFVPAQYKDNLKDKYEALLSSTEDAKKFIP